MTYEHVTDLIGNTPLLKIDPRVHGLKKINLYGKLEYCNPFGSIKDRVAYAMIKDSIEEIQKQRKTVLESSSGNTAKALAALCSLYGIPFKTVTSRIKIPEVRMILQTLQAQIEELPSISECPDPFDPNDFLAYAKNLAKTEPDQYFLTDQYFNEKNPEAHYSTTGKELVDDLGKVDMFIGFLGTCGSSFGIGKYLKEKNPDIQVIGVVSSPGNDVPGGRMANELWEVGFFKKEFYDHMSEGTSQQAIEGMLELNNKCGMLCGPTTGLNYYAGLNKLKELETKIPDGETRNAVFIACDRSEPYMSYLKRHNPNIFARSTTSRQTVNSIDQAEIANTPTIEPKDATAYTQSSDSIIVDIRGNFAYSIGHLPNSINIVDELFAQVIEMGTSFPKNKKIIVVCSIGDISRKYAAFLDKQGFDAYSVQGGIASCKEENIHLNRSLHGQSNL